MLASTDSHLWLKAQLQHIAKIMDPKVNIATPMVLPDRKRAIPLKWVYDMSGKGDLKHRARLVMLGFLQRAGIDFENTFSTVVRWTTMRNLLAHTVNQGWDTPVKFDISAAYPSTPIDKEVFVKQPPGHEEKDSVTGKPLVWRLNGNMPGGRQCGRTLNKQEVYILTEIMHFKQLEGDTSVFYFSDGKGIEILLPIWVDDLFFFPRDIVLARPIIDKVIKAFENLGYTMHDLGAVGVGPSSDILGVKVVHDKEQGTITFDMDTYISEIEHMAKEYGLVLPAKAELPATPNTQLFKPAKNTQLTSNLPITVENYRSLVYKVMYLAQVAHPVIGWATQQAASHVEAIDSSHVKWLANLVAFIVTNRTSILTYSKSENAFHWVITDSTWAECKETRKSTGGYFIFYGTCCIEWKTSKHDFHATSSNHAEYYEQNQGAHAAIAYQNFFKQLQTGLYDHLTNCTPLFADNKGAIAQALDPVHYKGTKHFELNLHNQRALIANKRIAIFYIPTELNIADLLAKQPAKQKFINDAKIILGYASLDVSRFMFDTHKKKMHSIDDLVNIAIDFRREQSLAKSKAAQIRKNL